MFCRNKYHAKNELKLDRKSQKAQKKLFQMIDYSAICGLFLFKAEKNIFISQESNNILINKQKIIFKKGLILFVFSFVSLLFCFGILKCLISETANFDKFKHS